MARLSNFELRCESGDRQESPAGIVALFIGAHNLAAPRESIFL